MTNRERVLALIRSEPGLTDSEIVERTGITPHQQVNSICRELSTLGLTRRERGAKGLIVNTPGSTAEGGSTEESNFRE